MSADPPSAAPPSSPLAPGTRTDPRMPARPCPLSLAGIPPWPCTRSRRAPPWSAHCELCGRGHGFPSWFQGCYPHARRPPPSPVPVLAGGPLAQSWRPPSLPPPRPACAPVPGEGASRWVSRGLGRDEMRSARCAHLGSRAPPTAGSVGALEAAQHLLHHSDHFPLLHDCQDD